MDPVEQNALQQALDRMWVQFLPQTMERVGVLDAAAVEFSASEPTAQTLEEAATAAHKLAGVLGTFGLTRGTALAREAEILCSGEAEADPELGTRLASIAAELSRIIESRK